MVNAVKWMWHAADGFKTLGAALVVLLLGLADFYDYVPIGPFLTLMFGPHVSSVLLIVLPVLFGALRFVTNGKVRWLRSDDSQEPF